MTATRRRALSLRQRVTLYAALLGLVLCSSFAIAAWFIAEDYEDILLRQVLEAEAAEARERLARGEPPDLPTGSQLHGWLLHDGHPPPADLDPQWLALPPGIHELPEQGIDGLHVGVFDGAAGRLLYRIDLGPIERAEDYLIALSISIIVAGGLLTALAASWLAGHALRPLDRLADAVDALPLQPQPTALAGDLPDDGLRQLAAAIDGYQQRLTDAAGAEQAFFADASHELRSPVAALRGAVEVLIDDPEPSAAMRRRLLRIDRATDELAQLIDALLLSARELPEQDAKTALEPVLREVCGLLAERARARGVGLLMAHGAPDARSKAPERWLRTLLLNLLRALVDRPGVVALRPRCSDHGIDVSIDGDHGVDSIGTRSDLGFPLQLSLRLCRRLGGELEVGRGLLRIRLPMVADAAG